ncbi:SPOSA6832_04629 [Sporobolomyces salmonicolor]|uniref:SPOSA6832_04629-mRNA-1:cds n=1 Tax=Sporidiobolus salmonicolor TaxID=5005 RepID=A0A0D6ESI1_SPOSA|nr:SPOSA6832_04629 [Sporobolomyces salmonicolor]
MSGKIVSQEPAPADFFATPNPNGFTIDLQKKVYVVSGGNRGLGHGISEALLQANATVAPPQAVSLTPPRPPSHQILYNSAKDAEEVAAKLEKKWGNKVKAYQCNVGDSPKVKSTFAQIEKDLGEIHGLVANSGISIVKPALELTADDFHKVFDVNVLGVFNTAQAVADLWIPRKHKGSIVVVSSMSDSIVNSPITQVFYNSSKGAVSNLTRCLAAEWAPNGIRVNNICPGFIETDQTNHMPAELRNGQCSEVPLGRFSKVFEQATQVVFLLSPYTSYQTGSSVYVDGGYTIW